MTNSPNTTALDWLDFAALPSETIDLSPEVIDQAVDLSLQIPQEERQWQTYLNTLALFAVEEWLGQRAVNLTINRDECSILQPALANAISAVCNLKINQFNLCLIATGSLTDEAVALPRAIVDLAEFVPHFYVLVEVQEELSVARIQGFLSYQQLVRQRATVDLQPEADWTYQLPAAWFEDDANQLLLYLECLEPAAIALPVSERNRSTQLQQMRSQLQTLLPQLQSSRQMWDVLTWEQGAVVLTHRELLNWVYQVQREAEAQPVLASRQKHLSDVLQLLTQQAVNVGRWLRDELDDVAQELSWVFLPASSLAPSTGMLRSTTEELETIVTRLNQKGVDIPLEARGAYQDLQVAELPLRLYAITWPLLSGTLPEWTLLLVLGGQSGISLPPGLQLRVSDQTSVLVEKVLDIQDGDSYLFTRIVGTWDEKFIVTVTLPNGTEQTLPPFSFNPGRVG